MSEVMTVRELAKFLKMSRRQIYSMTETRTRTGSMSSNPLPCARVNGNLRFRRVDIDQWLERCVDQEKAA